MTEDELIKFGYGIHMQAARDVRASNKALTFDVCYQKRLGQASLVTNIPVADLAEAARKGVLESCRKASLKRKENKERFIEAQKLIASGGRVISARARVYLQKNTESAVPVTPVQTLILDEGKRHPIIEDVAELYSMWIGDNDFVPSDQQMLYFTGIDPKQLLAVRESLGLTCETILPGGFIHVMARPVTTKTLAEKLVKAVEEGHRAGAAAAIMELMQALERNTKKE